MILSVGKKPTDFMQLFHQSLQSLQRKLYRKDFRI